MALRRRHWTTGRHVSRRMVRDRSTSTAGLACRQRGDRGARKYPRSATFPLRTPTVHAPSVMAHPGAWVASERSHATIDTLHAGGSACACRVDGCLAHLVRDSGAGLLLRPSLGRNVQRYGQSQHRDDQHSDHVHPDVYRRASSDLRPSPIQQCLAHDGVWWRWRLRRVQDVSCGRELQLPLPGHQQHRHLYGAPGKSRSNRDLGTAIDRDPDADTGSHRGADGDPDSHTEADTETDGQAHG
jgi:hypothetical protein